MFSRDAFKLLGLEHGVATDRDVRQAYAKRLKAVRPEDDPAAFMALREAYEVARNEVRFPQFAQEEDDDEETASQSVEGATALLTDVSTSDESKAIASTHGEPVGEALKTEPASDDRPAPGKPLPERTVHDVLADLKSLAKSPFGRTNLSAWSRILDRDEAQSIDDFQTLSDELRYYICVESGFESGGDDVTLPDWLSRDLFDLLDTHFGWTQRQYRENLWAEEQTAWLLRVENLLGRVKTPEEEAEERRMRRRRRKLKSYQGSSAREVVNVEHVPAWKGWSLTIARVVFQVAIMIFLLRSCLNG